MNCHDFLQFYTDYTDGVITDRRLAARIEAHLAACQRCARRVDSLERALEVLRSDEVAPSPGFLTGLHRRLRAEVSIGDPIVPTSAGLAAALLLATGMGLLLSEARGEKAEEPPAARLAPVAFDTLSRPVEELNVTLPPFTHSTLEFHSSQEPLELPTIFLP